MRKAMIDDLIIDAETLMDIIEESEIEDLRFKLKRIRHRISLMGATEFINCDDINGFPAGANWRVVEIGDYQYYAR